MLSIAVVRSAYQVYQGDYWKAAASVLTATGFTLTFSTVYDAASTIIVVTVIITTGFTCYATYSMLSYDYELRYEF